MIDAKTYSLLAKASYTADIDGTEINETQEELNNLYKNFNQINPGWEVLSVNGKYYTSWASGFDGVAYLKQYTETIQQYRMCSKRAKPYYLRTKNAASRN